MHQLVIEPVSFDNCLDQAGVGFWGGCERAADYHDPDFLAGTPQPHRMREGHARFVIRQNWIGGEAIFEKCREPARAKMDRHLIRTDLDPPHQGEKDDPLPQ